MGSPNIFIGYRRGDGAGWAGRLHADLRARLGPTSQIFMDVDGIPPGEDFRAYIDGAIGQCDAFVALIGPNWLDAHDEHGRRRLDDPHDFVRLEITSALNRNIRVIPVVVGGARLPRPEDLPEALSRLVERHAVSLDNETWELGVSKIVGAFVQPTDPQPPPPTQPTRRPYAETSAGPPSRPHPNGAIIAILVAALVLAAGVGATVVVLSLQRSSSAGAATPASVSSPPAPTSTAPPATTSSPETTAPTRPPTTNPPKTTAPIPAARVVARYYDAINARDYQAAWALVGGSKFGQTYDEFAAGFANTAHDTLRITGVNGSTVAVELVATHHDGSIRTYRGTYTVLAGRIIEGNLRRVS